MNYTLIFLGVWFFVYFITSFLINFIELIGTK